MSKLRGNAALHCVVTTFKERGPDIRYYLAVYTEDLDHYHEIPLTSQQWRLALTTPLPITYFDQTGDCINGENQTELLVAGNADAEKYSRHVRAADACLRRQYAQARMADSSPWRAESCGDHCQQAECRPVQDVPSVRG